MRRASVATLALVMLAALSSAGGWGCTASGDQDAREQYNEALAAYEAGKWDDAAKGFLEARNQAGPDPELRFRAAYNLGLTHARQADAASAEPQKAIDLLRQSAAWFRDAVRLDPGSEDARVNLEVVLRRIQVLADQLNKGQNSLEARLDRVIEDQRALRDQIRELMDRVAESGGAAEPVAFQAEFDALATEQRSLLADAGTVSDLAGEELDLLQNKAEDQRTQEDQVRLVQLQNLDHYLQQARGNLSDTRRLLRRLQGDKGHRRADTALADLKRAREQLQDPVTVLKGIAQDQMLVTMHSSALEQLGKGSLTLGTEPDAPAPKPPAWLTTEHLNERQSELGQRTGEVLARFQAGVDAAAQAGNGQGSTPGAAPNMEDPKQKRMLAAAGEAIPFLQSAVSAMDGAAADLAGQRLADAAAKQGQALEAVFAAIERFSDIRNLIELTYRDHAAAIALLTPPDELKGQGAAVPPELANLSGKERTERVQTLVDRNVERLRRLDGLFDDELQVLAQQAQQAAAAGQQGGAGQQPGAAGPPPEQLEAAKQQYEHAKALRQQAEDALLQLRQALGAAAKPGAAQAQATQARAAADQAMEHIEALRRLFFSIIEHLKELLQNQTNTHDGTASATALTGEALAAQLGPLADAQGQHAGTGEALAQALAEQADAAAQAPAQDPAAQGQAQDAAQRLAQAAQEVREATTQMQGAAELITKDRDNATAMSVDMTPTLEAQKTAMEHLANAIRLLEPPQQNQQDQQQDQQQEQQQEQKQQQDQQQQQEQEQQEVSQQQAQRRLQEIRDREAERQRQQRRQERFQPEPVEKDW